MTKPWAEREQDALRWMYAGVEAGEEPQSTLAAMFKERADAEGRLADQLVTARTVAEQRDNCAEVCERLETLLFLARTWLRQHAVDGQNCGHASKLADELAAGAPAAPPEPLAEAERRVLDAAEDYYLHQQEPAVKLPEEADKLLHWMEQNPIKWQALLAAVAALRARKEEQGG